MANATHHGRETDKLVSAAAVSDTMSDERHGPYEGLLDLLQRPSHALNDHEAEDTIHIDGFLYKVALRLLGSHVGTDVIVPILTDPDAAPAWVDASKYLQLRIQSTPQQKLQSLNQLSDFSAWVTTCKEELHTMAIERIKVAFKKARIFRRCRHASADVTVAIGAPDAAGNLAVDIRVSPPPSAETMDTESSSEPSGATASAQAPAGDNSAAAKPAAASAAAPPAGAEPGSAATVTPDAANAVPVSPAAAAPAAKEAAELAELKELLEKGPPSARREAGSLSARKAAEPAASAATAAAAPAADTAAAAEQAAFEAKAAAMAAADAKARAVEAGAQVEEAVQGKALAAFGAKSEADKEEDKQIDSKYNAAAAAAKQTAAFANAAVADAENDVGVAEVELAEAEKKAEAAEADDAMSADAKAEAAEALRAAKETLKVKKGALNAAREAARQQKQGANDRMEAEKAMALIKKAGAKKKRALEVRAKEKAAKDKADAEAAAVLATQKKAESAAEQAANAEAADAAAKRMRVNKAVPESFWNLEEPVRELLEAVFFHAHVSRAKKIARPVLEAATLWLESPSVLLSIWGETAAGQVRASQVHSAFEKLPAERRSRASEIEERTQSNDITVFNITSKEPTLELESSSLSLQEFFVAQALCKGFTLPPEVAQPWQWHDWWMGTLKIGRDVGKDFERGLLKSSAQASTAAEQGLLLRSAIANHRPTAISAVSLLLRTVLSVDLRDNRLTDDEALMIASALPSAPTLLKLNLAGNRLTALGVKSIGQSMRMCAAPTTPDEPPPPFALQEIDLSRNKICDNGGTSEEGLVELGKAVAVCGKFTSLNLSKIGAESLAGQAFVAQVHATKVLGNGEEVTARALKRLNLSGNSLGPPFCDDLAKLFERCVHLSHLDLSDNEFGVAGGKACAKALPKAVALKFLDLSGNNLCDCSPRNPAERKEWTGDVISALCDALHAETGATLNELLLHDNALCGVWHERICGEVFVRGTYKTSAIDMLVAALERERMALRPKEGIRLDRDNLLRPADEKRLIKALKDNASKPQKSHSVSLLGGAVKAKSAAEEVVKDSAADEVAAQSFAVRRGTNEPNAASITPDASLGATKVEAGSAAPSQPAIAVEATAVAAAAQQSQSPAEREVSPQTVPAERDASPAAQAKPGEPAAPGAAAGAAGAAKPKPAATARPPKAGGGKAEKKGDEKKAGKAQTERDAKPSAGAEAEAEADGKKAARAGYGQQQKVKKKKVVEEVVEEVVNPFANSPLMITMCALQARTGAALDSPTVGANAKVPQGSLVRVAQTEQIKMMDRGKACFETRMYIALDGDTEALGWVTGVAKDDTENLRLATAGYELMRTTKSVRLTDSKEEGAKKLEELPKDTLLRVIETVMMPDGTEKIRVARDGMTAESIGWVVAGKEGQAARNIEPCPTLKLSFDLKVHTAKSMARALQNAQEKQSMGAAAFKKVEGLPSMVAGRRPTTKAEDGPEASRHKTVTTPATVVLLFNCHNAAFEVVKWTGKEDFNKLSGESSFDLISKHSKKRMGRVKLANELGMPFLDRVEVSTPRLSLPRSSFRPSCTANAALFIFAPPSFLTWSHPSLASSSLPSFSRLVLSRLLSSPTCGSTRQSTVLSSTAGRARASSMLSLLGERTLRPSWCTRGSPTAPLSARAFSFARWARRRANARPCSVSWPMTASWRASMASRAPTASRVRPSSTSRRARSCARRRWATRATRRCC